MRVPCMRRLAGAFACAALALLAAPAAAAQYSLAPLSLTDPGAPANQFLGTGGVADLIDKALQSLAGKNSGTASPVNGPGAAPYLYEDWFNTSASPPQWEIYDGAQWVPWAALNSSTHVFSLVGLNVTGQATITYAGIASGVLQVEAPTDTNGAGVYLLGNGATTPSKTIRAFSGLFQVLNDAYSTVLFQLTDAGVMNLPALNVAGAVCNSSAGLFSTTTGKCPGDDPSDVTSVSNSDGTLTISPTTGAVVASCAAATTGRLGCVEPDGTIITDASGAITVALATSSAFGVVEGDGATLTITAGVIKINLAHQNIFTANQTINKNSAGYLPGSNLLNLQQADAVTASLGLSASADPAEFQMFRVDNTIGSPNALASSDVVGEVIFNGYNGSAYYAAASIRAIAINAWSGSAEAAAIDIYATPSGGTSQEQEARFDGGVGIGTTTTEGVGTLNIGAAQGLYNAGTAPTGSGGGYVLATAPSISSLTVTSAFTATNLVTNADLVQAAAATLKGNTSASAANDADFTISGLTDISTPNITLDTLLIYNHTTGTLEKTNASELVAAVSSGVTSFNGRTGAVVPASGDYTTQQLTVNAGAAPSCTGGFLGSYCNSISSNLSGTVTFTNGSANIAWATNTPQVGNVVWMSTTGGLPTNFAAAANYYVISVVGTTVQVAATATGSAIVAGSAGSGTQTGHIGADVSSNGAQDVNFINLTAGDWLCYGSVVYSPNSGVTATFFGVWLSTTSNTDPTNATQGQQFLNVAFTAGAPQVLQATRVFHIGSGGADIYEGAEVTNSGAAQFNGNVSCFHVD